MKIWIPTIGDHVRLTENWSFLIKADWRNMSMLNLIQSTPVVVGGGSRSMTLPAGTVLKIERVYIRSSFREFDSVTFRVRASPDRRFEKCRFFAALSDVNKMEAEPLEP